MEECAQKTVKTAALVLVAISAIMASYQYKISVDGAYPNRTFSVDGTGDIDTTPDVATFSVTVMTEGSKNVAEVQAANTEKTNTVNAFLKDQGVDKKDLKTAQYSLMPRYGTVPCLAGRPCPAPTISGYSLTQTLQVKVRNTDQLGDLLSGVVGSGANSVSEVSFVVDNDEAAKDAAREKAITDAKKKAVATAKSAGFRLGRLVTLYENTNPVPYDGVGGGTPALMVDKAAAPAIEPGTQSTKVQVTLTYEIVN